MTGREKVSRVWACTMFAADDEIPLPFPFCAHFCCMLLFCSNLFFTFCLFFVIFRVFPCASSDVVIA